MSNANPINLMIDLETLGTTPGSVILSIGAVVVDHPAPIETFYDRISISSSLDVGLAVDSDTMDWWKKQPAEVMNEAFEGTSSITNVLFNFSAYCSSLGGEVIIWGNGADFDNPLLAAAYNAARLTRPWKYHNSRCFRTIKALYPHIEYVKPTVAHHALEDAKAQAIHLSKVLKYIREVNAERLAKCQ